MSTRHEINDAAGAQRRVFLKRMLPIAAGLALALTSATTYAQSTPNAGCNTQKAGEGESQYSRQQTGEGENQYARQQAGEGESQYSRQQTGEGENQYARQQAGEGENQYARQQAAGSTVMPCKG